VTLAGLRLADFRGYESLDVALPGKLTVLKGENAQGKTNFLRAVELLGLGGSPISPESLVRHGAETALVEGVLADGASSRMAVGVEEGRLRLRAGGKPVTRGRWVGRLPVLFVGPEDREQVAGPPSARRDLLDELLEQAEPSYRSALGEYRQALRQRNRALENPDSTDGEIEIWEEPMARAGGVIVAARARATTALAPLATAWHRELAGGSDRGRRELSVSYLCGLGLDAPGGAKGAGAALREALSAGRERDRAAGATLTGPHRDDVEIACDGHALKSTGSSGEVWSAIIALAFASAELLGSALGSLPVLLMDDCAASLDDARRERLFSLLAGLPQAFLTTTADVSPRAGVEVFTVKSHSLSGGEGGTGTWNGREKAPGRLARL
jgi:DNA replication and repair protein RecF